MSESLEDWKQLTCLDKNGQTWAQQSGKYPFVDKKPINRYIKFCSLANSEDTDEMHDFIRVCTVCCREKQILQRRNTKNEMENSICHAYLVLQDIS